MRKYKISCGIGALVAAMLSNAAFAQQDDVEGTQKAPANAPIANDEIVVTALKRTENLQDVPAAISVVSAEQLEARGAVNISSLQTLVPSLGLKESPTSIDSSVFLRGVGTINFSIAAEPSVGFVVDGVTYARSAEAFGDLYDIERIEVLRGPQGTLFGKNASAGVINIVSKRPGNEFAGYAEATATSDSEYKMRGAFDIPLAPGITSRFSASYGQYDGAVRNLTLDRKVNGYKRYGVRGMIVAEASPALTFTLIGDWRRQKSDCCGEVIGTVPDGPLSGALAGIDVDGAETREIRQNTLTRTRETSWGISLQGDLDVGAIGTLTSITAYRRFENYGIRDGDFIDTVYQISGGHQLVDSGGQPSKTFTQELRLASPGYRPLEYVLGAFYYNAKQQRTFQRDDIVCSSTTLPEVSPGLSPCAEGSSTLIYPSAVGTYGSTIENYAFYANLTYNLTDSVRLIAGGRYTHDDISAFNNRTPANVAGPGVVASGADFDLHTTQNDFSGKLGVQFDVASGLMTYATWSEGYKGPAFNVFFNQTANQLDPIAAETSQAGEVGAKFRTDDGTLTLNTAVFYAKYKNFQANSFVNLNGSVITQLTNAGSVSTKGVEIASILRPMRNFRVNIGLAYTDAQIDKFNVPPGAAPGTSDRRGEQLPLAPKFKGTIGANWTIETGGFANIELGGQVALVSDQVSSLEARPAVRQAITIDGYAIADASIGIVDPNGVWRINVFGRNLTDQSYASLITTGGPGGSYRYLLPRDVDRYFGITGRVNF